MKNANDLRANDWHLDATGRDMSADAMDVCEVITDYSSMIEYEHILTNDELSAIGQALKDGGQLGDRQP